MLSISQKTVPQSVNTPAFKGAEAPKVAKNLFKNPEFQKVFKKELSKAPARATKVYIMNNITYGILKSLLAIQNGFKKIGNLFK